MDDFPGVKVQNNNFLFGDLEQPDQQQPLAKSEYIPPKTETPLEQHF